MISYEECKPELRYLHAYVICSNDAVKMTQKQCLKMSQEEDFQVEYRNFLSWTKKKTEISLFTLMANFTCKIPKTFDCLFDLNNPSNVTFTSTKLIQSIYEGRQPIDSILDFHKHLCIFDFTEAIPELVQQMYIWHGHGFIDPPKDSLEIGICHSKDYPAILQDKQKMLHYP